LLTGGSLRNLPAAGRNTVIDRVINAVAF